MPLQRAQFDFRALLLAIIPRPDGESRPFRAFHTQLGDAADDLEQPAGYATCCAHHSPVRRNLPQPEENGDRQRSQAEDESDDPEDAIVKKDDAKYRKQEDDRQQAIGNDPLQAVANILECHSRHGQIAGRLAV